MHEYILNLFFIFFFSFFLFFFFQTTKKESQSAAASIHQQQRGLLQGYPYEKTHDDLGEMKPEAQGDLKCYKWSKSSPWGG